MKFSKQRTVNRVVLLDVNEITSSPYQPRRQFDPKGMKELADSISQSGLLQPITVRRTETGYELIAGERRLMACRMLHLDKIPAIVEQFDDEKSAVFSLVENLQRKDLNYFEEAVGIQQLMQRCEMTQQQVAERLGKAQSTVANKLRLLTFSEPLRRRMLDAGLTERHARALLKLPDEITVAAALEHIVRERPKRGGDRAVCGRASRACRRAGRAAQGHPSLYREGPARLYEHDLQSGLHHETGGHRHQHHQGRG